MIPRRPADAADESEHATGSSRGATPDAAHDALRDPFRDALRRGAVAAASQRAADDRAAAVGDAELAAYLDRRRREQAERRGHDEATAREAVSELERLREAAAQATADAEAARRVTAAHAPDETRRVRRTRLLPWGTPFAHAALGALLGIIGVQLAFAAGADGASSPVAAFLPAGLFALAAAGAIGFGVSGVRRAARRTDGAPADRSGRLTWIVAGLAWALVATGAIVLAVRVVPVLAPLTGSG